MGRVKLWAWFEDEYTKYLYHGNYMTDMLYKELQEAINYFDNDSKIGTLTQYLETQKQYTHTHPGDSLLNIYTNRVSMDFEFAKSLKLYDIVYPDCFHGKDEIGEALIDLLNFAEIRFVLEMRVFESIDYIELNFVPCHSDWQSNLQYDLRKK